MAKLKTVYFCSECGYESSKWMGQCPSCKEWNTMSEETVAKLKSTGAVGSGTLSTDKEAVHIDEIELYEEDRYRTGFEELDRVLGSGIVAGSLVLVGGDPGIGKSTILLQVCRNLAMSGKSVLYVSGEESLKQIKLRALRIGSIEGDLRFLCETDVNTIVSIIGKYKPQVVIIDSIQTMYIDELPSAQGSVTQVRESTLRLMQLAKQSSTAIFIVGHVTKDGQVAGPRTLEHMVDTVLYFEGERSVSYRIIRAVKNRFGSTNEIGVFEMRSKGLVEVSNPSEYMLSGRPISASGSVVSCLLEGSRPLLVEVQALVTPTNFGMPKRTAVGTDFNRVSLLMAVIEKRCLMQMSKYDAYINIAGGMRMNEPALDLAIVLALVSSLKNKAIDDKVVIFGEVGLSGEVRAVSMSELRIREAYKLGFETCILPKAVCDKLNYKGNMKLIAVNNIREAIDALM